MMRQPDERINVHGAWIKDFVALLAILISVNIGYALIFMTIYGIKPSLYSLFQLELLAYMIFITLLLCLVLTLIRHKAMTVPIQRIGEAARQVTKGNYSVRIAPLRKDGKKDYTEVVFDDFNIMVGEIQSTETLKLDFIANVSHELKTPLAIIQNYAEALNQTNSGELRRDYANTIQTTAKKLAALVTNILRLNQLENKEIIPHAPAYQLSEQLRYIALEHMALWEKKGISFEADIQDDVWVRCDPEMMGWAWTHLLANAIEYTETGGAIAVSLNASNGIAEVWVMDTGCGMDERTIRHAFDKFFQGDASHSQEGNGLGLSLAYKAIQLAGGTLVIQSIKGRGTSMIVKLKTAEAL